MDTQQIMKEYLDRAPEDIRRAIFSVDLPDKFQKVSKKYGLHIDQDSSLQTETLLIMLGLEPTSDFSKNIQKELELNLNVAQAIAQDINSEILYPIRASLQKIQWEKEERVQTNPQPQTPPPFKATVIPTPPAPIFKPTLEQAGRFTIEKPPVGFSAQYEKVPIKKEVILNIIEDLKEIEDIQNKDTSMIDHLLNQPVGAPEKKEVQVPPPPSKPPETPKPPYTSDPYREQI